MLPVFADGSMFGPKKSQESDEVLGMFDGIDVAKRMSRDATCKQRALNGTGDGIFQSHAANLISPNCVFDASLVPETCRLCTRICKDPHFRLLSEER
jgi:hypothetical protein